MDADKRAFFGALDLVDMTQFRIFQRTGWSFWNTLLLRMFSASFGYGLHVFFQLQSFKMLPLFGSPLPRRFWRKREKGVHSSFSPSLRFQLSKVVPWATGYPALIQSLREVSGESSKEVCKIFSVFLFIIGGLNKNVFDLFVPFLSATEA